MHVISVSASAAQDAERQILNERIELLVLDTPPIYLPGLPSLQGLKEKDQICMSFSSFALKKTEVGIARILGVDVVLVRPLSKAKLLSVVDAFGSFGPFGRDWTF